jgi:NAD(P)-dependent dehydrogenase (short-subunit alcohol dehydrogenase family)|tara:strand:- start:1057 stop:1821 length:765 start_codon:yes stop_codon:yes gene_type:complete
MFKKINLKNKTALVTGAGKGLGKACAVALAEAGAKVIIISRTLSDLNKVEKMIKKTKGSSVKLVSDVTSSGQISKFLSRVKRLDILVNNAGTNIPEHFTKVKKENMEYLVDLNMKAAFNIAQICAKKMTQQKNRKKIGGAIVNMSSQMSKVGGEIRSVYNMNKAGIDGLTKGMALELAKYNIRVNSICPTFVETPMVKKFFKDKNFKKKTVSNILLKKAAKESDIATAVAFLVADSSSCITGTNLLVDGGWTAK